jgi:O-antigen ligase
VAIRERGGIPEVTVAHNTALGVLVEMGPVGVLAFMAIPLLILWSARRLPPAERWLTWGVVVTWLSASMSLTWEANKTTWFSFGLFAAVATRPWIRWPLREELQRRAGLARSRAERWDTAAGDAT